MATQYIFAAAPQAKVEQAIEELIAADETLINSVLVSTKGYRHAKLSHFNDLAVSSFDEQVDFDLQPEDKVTLIQFNQTLISFINVYRFLRANGVNAFTIKVAGKPAIHTSVNQVFANFSHSEDSSEDRVSWIDPAKITLRHEFAPAFHGQIIDGNWDLETTKFNQSVLFYESFKKRIEQGTQWPDTRYYQDVIASIKDGESRFGCRTIAAFDKYCEALDALYQDMQNNGWQQHQNSDYVTINIGRNGQLLFNDGRHRLTMAKLLKIDSIPVKVAVRHARWVEFKNEIKAFADRFYNGKVYARINHLDLCDLQFSQEDERLEVISSHIAAGNNTVLDIGTHWGYFCSALEDQGFSCTGVEADVANFYFLNKLRIASEKQFTAISSSIFDVISEKTQFDVVLALNIFHHFIKTPEKHQQLVALLNNLDMNEMYLQTHSPDEPQMKDSFQNYPAEEFAQFVIANSCLNKIEMLVEYDSGRKLFKLSR